MPTPILLRSEISGEVAQAGDLVVRLRTHSGSPYRLPTRVILSPREDPDPFWRDMEVMVHDGEIVFRDLIANVPYSIHAISEHLDHYPNRQITIPTGADEAKILEFNMAYRHTLLEGRILDSTRNPLPNWTFRIVAQEGKTPNVDHLRTDQEGRFQYPIPLLKQVTSRWQLIGTDRMGTQSRHLRMVIEGPFREENRPLGDLIAESSALLCDGQVLDSAGDPVAGARIWPSELGDPDGDPEGPFATLSDEEGRFSIHTPGEVAFRFLHVDGKGYQPVEADLASGNRGMRIRLGSLWGGHGNALLPPSLSFRDVSLRIRRLDGPKISTTLSLNKNGYFSVKGLSGDRYLCEVFCSDVPGPIETLGFTRPDRSSSWVDWGELDIRSSVRAIRLEIVDGDGLELRQVGIHDADTGRRLCFKNHGETLHLRPGVERFYARHEAGLSEAIESPGGTARLVLKAGQSVSLQTQCPAPASDPGWNPAFHGFRPTGYLVREGLSGDVTFPIGLANGVGFATIPSAGRYQVHLYLVRDGTDQAPTVSVPVTGRLPADLSVFLDPELPTTLDLPISAQDWHDALREAQSATNR